MVPCGLQGRNLKGAVMSSTLLNSIRIKGYKSFEDIRRRLRGSGRTDEMRKRPACFPPKASEISAKEFIESQQEADHPEIDVIEQLDIIEQILKAESFGSTRQKERKDISQSTEPESRTPDEVDEKNTTD